MSSRLFSRVLRINRALIGCRRYTERDFEPDYNKVQFEKVFCKNNPKPSPTRPKPIYNIDSYGQSTGSEYPFSVEKKAEGIIKRSQLRGSIGALSGLDVVKILEDLEAIDVKIFDVPQDLNYAENLVVASGSSTEHLKSVIQAVVGKFITSGKGVKGVHVEGLDSEDWMVVDIGNVVIHLFLPETRSNFDVEAVWSEK